MQIQESISDNPWLCALLLLGGGVAASLFVATRLDPAFRLRLTRAYDRHRPGTLVAIFGFLFLTAALVPGSASLLTSLEESFRNTPLGTLLTLFGLAFAVALLFPTFRARLVRHYQAHRVGDSIFLFAVAFVIILLLPDSIIFVDAGKAGVLFRRFTTGVQTDVVYGEGCHFIWPFNTMTIYDLRVSQTQTKFNILSKNGLSVGVETSIRYYPKPEYLGILHQQVGPAYVDKIILPEVQAAIRKLFGQYTPEEIYQTQGDLTLNARNDANLRLRERFIVLDDLLITSIELPSSIQAAIQSKLVAQQASQEMDFRIVREQKERERKSIEAEGYATFNERVRDTLDENVLRFKSIEAFLELAKTGNTNTVVFGTSNGIPMLLPMGGTPTGLPVNTVAQPSPSPVVLPSPAPTTPSEPSPLLTPGPVATPPP